MHETLPEIALRPAFWNVPVWAEILIYLLGIGAAVLCAAGIVRAVKLRRGPDAGPGMKLSDIPKERIKPAILEVFLQQRVSEGIPGKAHAVLFWGFILLFLGTATATLDWDVGHYILDARLLQGRFYLAYKLVLDIAGLGCLIALGYGLVRRFVLYDPRVEADQRFAILLSSLFLIILTGFLVEALRLAATEPSWAKFSPVGWTISLLFAGASPAVLRTAHIFIWMIHGVSALVFVACIPLTYYAHIFKTPTSIFWKNNRHAGAIPKIEDIEEQETFGISSFDQYGQVDRIRLDGCTECGRCRRVCPAFSSGSPLDPKSLVLTLQARMRGKDADRELVGGIIDREALWSCTTCGACARVCPAEIPIPEIIVGMRRHLALELGEFPEGLATALENTMSVGNPWGMDPGSRLNWTKGLDVPVAEEGEEYDVLYWVGCAASYDRRAQKIARAMVRLFRAAGVKFCIMAEERCHGEFARRAGEEYLFQTAALENIENLGRYRFKKIVAACPHCFNTLKNEYPQFEGGTFTVQSHAEWIAEEAAAGRLPLRKNLDGSAVFHDACYLARINGCTAAPREVIRAAGISLREAAKSGRHALCCGAGGSQIFMDRPNRVNVIRLKELKDTGAKTIAVSCPHCLTMLESAEAQDRSGQSQPPVADIAEIAVRCLEQ